MGYKILFVINAVLAALFGLAVVFVPNTVLQQFGAEVRIPELLLARFFGAALFTLGLVLFFASGVEQAVQTKLGMALLAGSVLELILIVVGMTASGVIRYNGWIAILVSVIFALGYTFVVFLQPRMRQ